MPRKRQPPPKRCPHCGALVPAERPACAECGSDAETGWSEDGLSGYSAADIPDAFTDEDYLDAVSDLPGVEQRGTGPATDRRKIRILMAVVAVVAIIGAAVLRSPRALVVLVVAAAVLLLVASPVRRSCWKWWPRSRRSGRGRPG